MFNRHFKGFRVRIKEPLKKVAGNIIYQTYKPPFDFLSEEIIALRVGEKVN